MRHYVCLQYFGSVFPWQRHTTYALTHTTHSLTHRVTCVLHRRFVCVFQMQEIGKYLLHSSLNRFVSCRSLSAKEPYNWWQKSRTISGKRAVQLVAKEPYNQWQKSRTISGKREVKLVAKEQYNQWQKSRTIVNWWTFSVKRRATYLHGKHLWHACLSIASSRVGLCPQKSPIISGSFA